MLVYERIKPTQPASDTKTYPSYTSYSGQLVSDIHLDNLQFMRDRLFFDHDYFEFIKDFI